MFYKVISSKKKTTVIVKLITKHSKLRMNWFFFLLPLMIKNRKNVDIAAAVVANSDSVRVRSRVSELFTKLMMLRI